MDMVDLRKVSRQIRSGLKKEVLLLSDSGLSLETIADRTRLNLLTIQRWLGYVELQKLRKKKDGSAYAHHTNTIAGIYSEQFLEMIKFLQDESEKSGVVLWTYGDIRTAMHNHLKKEISLYSIKKLFSQEGVLPSPEELNIIFHNSYNPDHKDGLLTYARERNIRCYFIYQIQSTSCEEYYWIILSPRRDLHLVPFQTASELILNELTSLSRSKIIIIYDNELLFPYLPFYRNIEFYRRDQGYNISSDKKLNEFHDIRFGDDIPF